ncbi:MFS transporter [soil metagenome]
MSRSLRPSRSWAGIWGAVFVTSWGGNQFSPLLVMYEDRAHYTAVDVNIFLGVYVLGLAPALLVASSLSDRHGRKKVMFFGLLAGIVGSALLAFGGLGPAPLAIGRLFAGFAVGSAVAVGGSWIKELSQPPFDLSASVTSGARRSSLAFTLGSGGGALVAGLLAQWGPLPEILPFLVYIVIAVPFLVIVARSPETQVSGGLTGPWWRQLKVPSAGHRRFARIVAVAAPWCFISVSLSYGYLPTQLRGVTGQWGLVFATAATVVALGLSSIIQPLGRRVHSVTSARALWLSILVMAFGIAGVAVAVMAQSVVIGLIANAVVGIGMGTALISCLLEVQQIAGARDLAGLTGVFYAVAYAGFLAPAVIAALTGLVASVTLLWIVVGLGALSAVWVFAQSRRHFGAR